MGGVEAAPRVQARAYQLEMFELAMKDNIIAAMDTGSGKTQIAIMRIQAELERSPSKLVWFTTPNVVLAHQQFADISSQLTQFMCKVITGEDKVHLWSTQLIWDEILKNINVVVCTQQVLLDALRNSFVQMNNISLLVVDEAHNCQKEAPIALVMREFYHSRKMKGLSVPHILGLTASPQISKKADSSAQLELLMDAICWSPSKTLTVLRQYVHMPEFVRLQPRPASVVCTNLLEKLYQITNEFRLEEDPSFRWLTAKASAQDLAAQVKLEKVLRKGTWTIRQLKSFCRHAETIRDSLGSYSCEHYITTCASIWHENRAIPLLEGDKEIPEAEVVFLDQKLEHLRGFVLESAPENWHLGEKARTLIEYLAEQWVPGIAIVVFVEQRSLAYALSHLLRNYPKTTQYRAFSFVGLADSRQRCLYEIGSRKEQVLAFKEFRTGERALCVATSALQEGIDIQAINAVIRFDEPKTFIAYIQSRGRARHPHSKFVCFPGTRDKYSQWDEMEAAMRAEYMDDKRMLAEAEATEDLEEDVDSVYISSLGATLNFNNAVQHLYHFCSTVDPPAEPVFVPVSGIGELHGARLVLQSTLAPDLQKFAAQRLWKNEKLARRDAAFQAVTALHKHGLIDDHFMPPQPERLTQESLKPQMRQRKIMPQLHPWTYDGSTQLFQYKLKISADHYQFDDLCLLMPYCIESSLHFQLFHKQMGKVSVSLTGILDNDISTSIEDTASRYTRSLFLHVFGHGSAYQSVGDADHIPVYVMPQSHHKPPTDEQQKFTDVNLGGTGALRPILLWKQTRALPYLCTFDYSTTLSQTRATITKLTRVQLFMSEDRSSKSAQTRDLSSLQNSEYFVRSAITPYGLSVILLPSIMEYIGIALRTQIACEKTLVSIGIDNIHLLMESLTTKSVSSILNYERLEFLGDYLLKHYASLHMYFEHPFATPEVLTVKTQEIINNLNLGKAVTRIGLEPYISSQRTPSKHWTFPRKVVVNPKSRHVTAKVLGDVAESIMGAAYLDSDSGGDSEAKFIRALRLLLPEHNWQPTSYLLAQTNLPSAAGSSSDRLLKLQAVLGYAFKIPALLVQALTHSHTTPGRQSYQRLEFLGDAILDRIVKTRIFACPGLSPARMTDIHHAVVSHPTLAYLASQMSFTETASIPQITGKTNPSLTTIEQTIHLFNLITTSSYDLRLALTDSLDRLSGVQAQVPQILSTKTYPWTLLHSLAAPKAASDIVESILAAIFFDSQGSFADCERFLSNLGLLDLLDLLLSPAGTDTQAATRCTAVESTFEVKTPLTRLRETHDTARIESLSQNMRKNGSGLEQIFHVGIVYIVDEELCRTEAVVGKEYAEYSAAEMALLFLKERGMNTESDNVTPAVGEAEDGISMGESLEDRGGDELQDEDYESNFSSDKDSDKDGGAELAAAPHLSSQRE